MYSNYAVGYNNVVVPDASTHGIAVGNTPGDLLTVWKSESEHCNLMLHCTIFNRLPPTKGRQSMQ